MNKSMKAIEVIILVIIVFFVNTKNASAITINALSCTQTNVESAISSAGNGDTVVVPSCPGGVSWASDIIVNKEIIIEGQTTGCPDSCINNTLIQDNCFSVQANNVRITGFTFSGTGTCLAIESGVNGFRIDHNKIMGWGAASSFSYGNKKYGVFDNNLIEDCTGECLYIKGDGNQSWADGGSGGGYTDGTIYIEDNVFDLTSAVGSGANAVDSGGGARWVFRYNTVNETSGYYGYVLEAHGHYWGERDGNDNAGTYIQEIYGNTFNSGADRDWGNALKSRGGKVLFYDNTFTGLYWNNAGSIIFWNKESDAPGAGCTVIAHDTLGIHINPWDGSCNNDDGTPPSDYPCPLQANNSYIWDNPLNFTVSVTAGSVSYIVEDRDYWDDVGGGDTNFNTGTSRPGTCAVDDVYWETDNKKLYRCTSTDTWTFIYESYTYPHPLRGTVSQSITMGGGSQLITIGGGSQLITIN